MIRVSRTDGKVELVAEGNPAGLVAEVAIATVLVAQRVGETEACYNTESALDLIASTAKKILEDLRADDVAN